MILLLSEGSVVEHDDTYHSDGGDHSDDHYHTREACKHALDPLNNGDLLRALIVLNEARAAIERAEHDATAMQEQRETAYDCYD